MNMLSKKNKNHHLVNGYLSEHSVYRSTIQTVCLFFKSTVQMSGCTGTVFCQSSHLFWTVCRLRSLLFVQMDVFTYSEFIHFYSPLFVRSSLCTVVVWTVICLYSKGLQFYNIELLHPVSAREGNPETYLEKAFFDIFGKQCGRMHFKILKRQKSPFLGFIFSQK